MSSNIKDRSVFTTETRVEAMTRIALSIAALAALCCFDALSTKAKAYGDAPWCAVRSLGTGEVEWDCEYNSVDECAPTVIAGNRGFCNPNPYWVGPPPAPVTHPRHYRHRHAPHY